ncbi:MAG: maleylacetoacetate isomerase [Sneathiella sp.]|nr:maleylacetoacetate isomerase [Sneathiella sp.]|tara:strand:+ start:261 stop:971 length:711 start_codon:yes stop_codon:yes gene_type:complete
MEAKEAHTPKGGNRDCRDERHRLLYSYWRSSTAYRLRIALAFKQLPFELVPINLAQKQNLQSDFWGVNPQMLVPSYEEADFSLGQSMAILEYLDETCPQPPILPNDPKDRAYVRMLANVIACDIHPLNNVRVLNFLTDDLGISEQRKQRWYAHWISTGLKAFEDLLAKYGKDKAYCLGDSVTLADFCLIPQVYNATRFNCDLSDYPRVRSIAENCNLLPCFIDAHPDTQSDSTLFN